MNSVIKFLSKFPSGLLTTLGFLFCIFVFFASMLFVAFIEPYLEIRFQKLLLLFSSLLIVFLTPKLMVWTRKAIEQSIKDSNSDLIVDTDIPALCLDMLEAVQQKHRYTNYEAKLENYSDWMAFQVKNENHKVLGDVTLGMNPTKLEETIKNSLLASVFEDKRGAYDTFSQAEKDLAQGCIVTFDNAFIARNEFLDRLLNNNWFNSWFFGSYAFIEITLITQINLMKDVFDHQAINVKINTKAMAKRGVQEIAELRFELDDEDEPTFREIIMMHAPLLSYTEKEMKDSDTVEVINFMQKFIKNTRKLVRKV